MMGAIVEFMAENAGIIGLYMMALVIGLFGVYIALASMNISAKRRNAAYLKEILEMRSWGDFVKIIRNEEYVQAVIRGCEIVLEE